MSHYHQNSDCPSLWSLWGNMEYTIITEGYAELHHSHCIDICTFNIYDYNK